MHSIYIKLDEKLHEIRKVLTKYKKEDLKYGEGFTYSFNEFIFDLNSKDSTSKDLSDNEIYLAQVERSRNKFVNEYKSQSLDLSFFILNNLVLIGYKQSDLRFLNSGLKVIEKIKSENITVLDINSVCLELLAKLKELCLQVIIDNLDKKKTETTGEIGRIFTSRILSQPNKLNIEVVTNSNKKVIVFSPNPYSLYTLSVLHLLAEHGIKVEAVIVRKIFNLKRISLEVRRDGKRLIKKVVRKLVFKDSQRTSENSRNLSDVKNELNIKNKNVIDWCKSFDVPLIKCNTINDNEIEAILSDIKPDYGVFTGGGIVSEKILNTFNIGILNCHAGILPHYRGMDVIEWPVLNGDMVNIGSTVHFMSKGVDEGEILYACRVEKRFNILSLRMELESFSPYLQVKALIDHLTGAIKVAPQQLSEGNNYYVMHPWLFNKSLEISNNSKVN
jgi:methionyl-tRNA formyltransferase